MTSETIIHQSTINELAEKIANLLRSDLVSFHSNKPTEPERPVYLTRKETANFLKITLPTLHNWSNEGLIKSHKINGRVLYLRTEVETLPLLNNYKKM